MNELGRTPKKTEMPFYETLITVWGNMERACQIAGIPYRKSGQKVSNPRKKPKEYYISKVREFYEKNKRLPKMKDFGKNDWRKMTNNYGKKSVFKEALIGDGKYRKVDYTTSEMRLFITSPELIKMLRTFRQINDRLPSYSDCKRGLLPHLSRFNYAFGGWNNALQEAFPVV